MRAADETQLKTSKFFQAWLSFYASPGVRFNSAILTLSIALIPFRAEGQNCGRVDLRPILEKVGVPTVRHRGGRLDSISFQVSEAASLKLDRAISARSLEHNFDEAQTSLADEFRRVRFSSRFLRNLRKPVCTESDVPSEDIESTRHARLRYLSQSLAAQALELVGAESLRSFAAVFSDSHFSRVSDSPRACSSKSVRLPKLTRIPISMSPTSNSDLVAQDFLSKAISQVLVANQMPLVRVPSGIVAIVGVRLSVESGHCEYLIRGYEGSECSARATSFSTSGTTSICEDGSWWVPREELLATASALWRFR